MSKKFARTRESSRFRPSWLKNKAVCACCRLSYDASDDFRCLGCDRGLCPPCATASGPGDAMYCPSCFTDEHAQRRRTDLETGE
jgi:hypothetical protein